MSLDDVLRRERRLLVASIARRFGDLDLAEDCVQDAAADAVEHWATEGEPANPAGWLMTTARRKALDRVRREKIGEEKLHLWSVTEGAGNESDFDADPDDDQLALVFGCCHPSLPREQQVALTLRSVCGLTTAEIAAAFLASEPAMAQRLVRAKRALRAGNVRFELPDPDELGARLPEVLAVIYLVFNEGWLASSPRVRVRDDLVREAVDLADLLISLMPREPEALALRALIDFHQSRAATRFGPWGQLILLADQDRSRWDRAEISAGQTRLDQALALRRPGPYQIQAAIAALHATAPTWQETDWPQIRVLYTRLNQLTPSPIVRLNRAVATRYTDGPAAALAEVDGEEPALNRYRLFHSTRAQFLRDLGRDEEAREAVKRAYDLATNPAERDLLDRRLHGDV